MTRAQAASAYESAIAPANAQLKKLHRELSEVRSNAQLQADVAPVSDAFNTAYTKLNQLANGYQPAATDLRTMALAIGALLTDFDTATHTTKWAQQLARHERAIQADSALVRAHLGLPPKAQ